jgi:hypothetical protein
MLPRAAGCGEVVDGNAEWTRRIEYKREWRFRDADFDRAQ